MSNVLVVAGRKGDTGTAGLDAGSACEMSGLPSAGSLLRLQVAGLQAATLLISTLELQTTSCSTSIL